VMRIWSRVGDVHADRLERTQYSAALKVRQRKKYFDDDLGFQFTGMRRRSLEQREIPIEREFADDLRVDRHLRARIRQRGVVRKGKCFWRSCGKDHGSFYRGTEYAWASSPCYRSRSGCARDFCMRWCRLG